MRDGVPAGERDGRKEFRLCWNERDGRDDVHPGEQDEQREFILQLKECYGRDIQPRERKEFRSQLEESDGRDYIPTLYQLAPFGVPSTRSFGTPTNPGFVVYLFRFVLSVG